MSKTPSGRVDTVHVCDQETRVSVLENDIAALQSVVKGMLVDLANQSAQLGDGRVEFMSIKKDLVAIMAAIVEMKSALVIPPTVSRMEQVIASAINWGVPAVILGGAWVIAKSGQIPGINQ